VKRLAPRLLTVLSLALLFLVGCDWLFSTSGLTPMILGDQAQWPNWRSLLEPTEQWIVTITLLLLPMLTAATWLILGRDYSIRTVTATGDVIRLAPGAIERIVCRDVKANVPEVLRVNTKARQGRKGPAVVVNIAASDKTPVPKIDADVRRETLKVLQHLLGAAESSQIRVIVYDVQGVSAKAAERDKRRRQADESKSGAHASSGKEKERLLEDAPKPLSAAPIAPKSFDAGPPKAPTSTTPTPTTLPPTGKP
jgi:hypothetical protein